MGEFEKVMAAMIDVNRMLVELSEKVDRINASLGAGRAMGVKADIAGRPSKYNWDALFTDGRFFTECEKGDRDRLVNSLTAGANQKFGKGKVRVKKVGAGVWVICKGDWSFLVDEYLTKDAVDHLVQSFKGGDYDCDRATA